MICPTCGSKICRPIQYGLPIRNVYELELLKMVKIGGCTIQDSNNIWHCFGCDHEFMANQDNLNIWVGSNYDVKRILILGESWYGDPLDLSLYIPNWVGGSEKDTLFSRLYCASHYNAHVMHRHVQRGYFMNEFAFANFVSGTIGRDNTVKATDNDFCNSETRLVAILKELNPAIVVILGVSQGKYSSKVCRQCKVENIVVTHPTAYGVKSELITNVYQKIGL